jgi:hypothetical protein
VRRGGLALEVIGHPSSKTRKYQKWLSGLCCMRQTEVIRRLMG